MASCLPVHREISTDIQSWCSETFLATATETAKRVVDWWTLLTQQGNGQSGYCQEPMVQPHNHTWVFDGVGIYHHQMRQVPHHE